MGEGDAVAAATKGSRPTITVPPRAPFESFFPGGFVPGFSPGPMTLVSNFFSPDSNSCSFSQLLAGAMASPIVRPGFSGLDNYGANECSKEGDFGYGSDKGSGVYKQNRPMRLMVPQSPMFYIPPGLSPAAFLNSPGFLSPLQSPFGMSHQQALAHVTAQAAFAQSFTQMQTDYQRPSATCSVEALEPQPSSMPNNLQQKNDTTSSEPHSLQTVEASHFEKKPTSFAGDKPSNDGYNWRKYGQKLVKAKENPRSYYKCTYPNCPVKKKVEHAPDGHITEVTYKGQHNHDLPQLNVRSKNSQAKDGSSVQNQLALEIVNEPQTATSELVKQELSTQLSTDQLLISNEHDEMEDSAVVIDEDNDDDEPYAKRRSTEIGGHVPAPSFKTVTEPKIVVQTRSEVDLLDDGYKWRKYGQKVVKGNSHPRSYYRCTYPGCNVRKHVERALSDPKSVITTYEGKHNHDIPIARSGSNNGPKSQMVMPVQPSM